MALTKPWKPPIDKVFEVLEIPPAPPKKRTMSLHVENDVDLWQMCVNSFFEVCVAFMQSS